MYQFSTWDNYHKVVEHIFYWLVLKKNILQEAVLRQICNVKNVAQVFDIHYTKHISCVSWIIATRSHDSSVDDYTELKPCCFSMFSWAWKALDDSRTRGMPQKCSFRWTENSSQSGSLHSDKKDVSRVGLWWLNFDEWFLNAGKWVWIIVFGICEKIIITINLIYFIWYWVDMYTRKYTYSNLLC